jgi:hypothetical protein
MNRGKESTTTEAPTGHTSETAKKRIETVKTIHIIDDCIVYHLD